MFFFFFFQAEDGIRDKLVTGVQTLLFRSGKGRRRSGKPAPSPRQVRLWMELLPPSLLWLFPVSRVRSRSLPCTVRRGARRSEERRVGKECRSRWWPYHERKKKEATVQARR